MDDKKHRKQLTHCRHCKTEGLWYLSDKKCFWYTTKKNRELPHLCPDGQFRTWKTKYPYETKPAEQLNAEVAARLRKLFDFPEPKN